MPEIRQAFVRKPTFGPTIGETTARAEQWTEQRMEEQPPKKKSNALPIAIGAVALLLVMSKK